MWRWRPDASGRWRAVPRTERREVGVFLQAYCGAGIYSSVTDLSRWQKP
jgi:hypothetical protein